MLEIQRIRNEKESVLQGLKKRNIDASQTIDKVLLIEIGRASCRERV